VIEFPSRSEKQRRTQGRKGAWKIIPKKFIRTNGLRRAHTYTNMIVKA
jgi:hypothetical protein